MSARPSAFGVLRTLVVLGRVSNLPTVWSNCLAAWLLGGSGPWNRFGFLCAAATLLYTAGMFLNDAFDVEFDRRYRPERPIIAGNISRRLVWGLSALLLALGWIALSTLGKLPLLWGSALILAIVLYDAVHKRTALAPVLMATCRLLLYLLAASTAGEAASPALWPGLALALYIVGLSYLARTESSGQLTRIWPTALLTAPIIVALILTPAHTSNLALVAFAEGLWVLRCLFAGRIRGEKDWKPNIPGLLAGIVLVDTLAAAAHGYGLGPVFVGLFLLALLLQRFAPAT